MPPLRDSAFRCTSMTQSAQQYVPFGSSIIKMLKLLYSDSNVTPDMQAQIERLILNNSEQILHKNGSLFLQQLLIKNFQKIWTVFILSGVQDAEMFITSNIGIMLDLQMNSTRFILCQFEEYPDDLQKDYFLKVCGEVELKLANTEQLEIFLQESHQYLQEKLGSGGHMLLYFANPDTIDQITVNTQLQFKFNQQIGEDEYIVGFIFYMPTKVEEWEDHTKGALSQDHEQQAENQDFVRDDYEEPMEPIFSIMSEEREFKQSTDQVKVSFDELEIQPLKVRSFAIIFSLVISPFPKEIKDDLNVLSTGSSLMSKNLTFGINRDQLFFLSFQLVTGKIETLYSQMKIKRNQPYLISLVYTETDLYKEVSLYVNGTIENQINLAHGIEPPRGYFWIGSEQALKLFKGQIKGIVFVALPLNQKHIKSIFAELSGALQHHYERKTVDIVAEVIEQLKEEAPVDQDESRYTATQSVLRQSAKSLPKNNRRVQIPMHLQKSYQVFEEEQKKSKQTLHQNNQQPRTMKELAVILRQDFQQNEPLFHKCHDLSLNFYWIFTTVQQMAPPFEENGNAKLPFEYLHQEITREKFDQYPVYAIEFERFAYAVHYGGFELSDQEIYNLGIATESMRHNKVYGNYILYDKFLLTVREAALSEQEIDEVRAQYNHDEKEADQDLIIYTNGIQKTKKEVAPNFNFFQQLVTLVGSEQEAFKYQLSFLYAYFVKNKPYVQKLTAIYIHKENSQELEIEGIDFFAYNEDQILRQKLDLSEEVEPKYFRVQYNGENMAMISFKTHRAEESFLLDQTFIYLEGQDATGNLETYAFEPYRLAGFQGTLIQKDGLTQLLSLHAQYLQKDPKVEEIRRSQPETLPQLAEHWNQGKFQIIINRCNDCDKHKTTTRHDETDFALKFNEFGQIFKDLYPNVEVIGNWDKTQQLEHFDVYVRGIAPQGQNDREGRFFLFRKNETLKSFLANFLKRTLKVHDEIILMAQAHGDTLEMAKRQEHFLKTQQYPPRSKLAQDHPCQIPDRPEKSTQEDVGQTGSDYICKNWGCGQPFKFENNPNGIKKCRHHPGRYEFGSKHGLWPECWTCCGKSWESEGCQINQHKGVPEKDFFLICSNVGPVDAKTGYPDSVCGMRFTEGEGGECKIGGSHYAAKWPDPQAKVYFLQKLTVNPALQKEREGGYNKQITLKPDMFREVKPYKEFVNRERQMQNRLIETEKDTRVCTNWTCGKKYTEIENRKKRMCKCHPGVFDFGHTASKIVDAIGQYKNDKADKIIWQPHWTCCRKPWEEPGCTKCHHKGPLASEYKPPKYSWPDPNAQIFFKKKVSDNWKKMLVTKYYLTPEQASQKYDMLCATLGSGGVISARKLPELCDKFNMNLWVCSEDLSFQFRFIDVVEEKAQEYLSDSHSNIDKHKFLDWWFADVDQVLAMSKS